MVTRRLPPLRDQPTLPLADLCNCTGSVFTASLISSRKDRTCKQTLSGQSHPQETECTKIPLKSAKLGLTETTHKHTIMQQNPPPSVFPNLTRGEPVSLLSGLLPRTHFCQNAFILLIMCLRSMANVTITLISPPANLHNASSHYRADILSPQHCGLAAQTASSPSDVPQANSQQDYHHHQHT
nr:hypothetical protein Iba_chr04dCG19610 [Ipomoea batatas]